MSFPKQRRDKQVRLELFENEPMARLAEQRLRQAGIPCFTRSLRGGPGLWGSAYNLPHDLLVFQSDEAQAREVLRLAPQDLVEAEAESRQPKSGQLPLLAGIIVAVMVLGLIVSMIAVIAD